VRTALVLLLIASLSAAACTQEQPNELRALLHARNFTAVELRLAELHDQYARGQITDIELRLRYRDFDAMPPHFDAVLDNWVSEAPSSYFALAVRGYHHRSVAFVVRGNGLAKEVKNWDFVQSRLKLAEKDMLNSLPRSKQPIMSYYVLLDTAGLPCDQETLSRYFELGTSSTPRSSLLYNRYLHYLKPRWCGSTERMTAHIDRAKLNGLPASALSQMAAIQADDEGRTLLDENKLDEAEQRFLRAAELGEPYGWPFQRESLFAVNEFSCKMASLRRFCPRPL
jgi:Domain of unknown function (DUF4034)